MPHGEKDTIAEMIAELMREAAVLVAVFGPLERLINEKPLTFSWVFIIVGLVLVLAVAGIAIEVKRL
jgi:hypothetical protein